MLQAVKFTLLGNRAVGKTCLIFTYKDGAFPRDPIQSGTEGYEVKDVTFANKPIHLTLWDTFGGDDDGVDRYRRLFYTDTDVFIVCFSIINRKSFADVENRWVPDLKKYWNVPFIIVGTKQDLRQDETLVNPSKEREQTLVSRQEGTELAHKLGAVAYLECSSLTQSGVKEVFETALAASVKMKRLTGQIRDRECAMM